jgi:hypothetical protein
MLEQEAKWFSDWIAATDVTALSPMCNVGSSTAHFRRVKQPWIESCIFEPAVRRGLRVVHVDIKSGLGVDIVGDLADEAILSQLSQMRFHSVFCANLLEHVTNRQAIGKAIVSLLPPGGFVLASAPHAYPLHLDPIDTGFRPETDELAACFPGTELSRGEVVCCGTFGSSLWRSPARLVTTLLRLLTPWYKPRSWRSVVAHVPWVSRHYEVTCVVLVKGAAGRPSWRDEAGALDVVSSIEGCIG